MHATPPSLLPNEISFGRQINPRVLEDAFNALSLYKPGDRFYNHRARLSAELTQTQYDPHDENRLCAMRVLYDMNELAVHGPVERPDVVQLWQLSCPPLLPREMPAAPVVDAVLPPVSVENLRRYAKMASEQPGSSDFQTLCHFVMAEIMMARTALAMRAGLNDGAMPAINAEKCKLTPENRAIIGIIRGSSTDSISALFDAQGAPLAFCAAQFALLARKSRSVGATVLLVPPVAADRTHDPKAIKIFFGAQGELQIALGDVPVAAGGPEPAAVRVSVTNTSQAWPSFLFAVKRQQQRVPSGTYRPF